MTKVLLLFISPLFVFGQLSVINPSFEGQPDQGFTPIPWERCMPSSNADQIELYGDY